MVIYIYYIKINKLSDTAGLFRIVYNNDTRNFNMLQYKILVKVYIPKFFF